MTDRDSSFVGPRRLMTSMTRPPAAGRRPSRNVAGEASAAHAKGRINKKSTSEDWAARCRRRSASERMCCCHRSSAPQLPVRKICSALHNASAVFGARMRSTLSTGRPRYASACALGVCGGWIRATGRFATCCRAGCRSRNSPTPGCCTSSSTSALSGQPPPGSSAERAA